MNHIKSLIGFLENCAKLQPRPKGFIYSNIYDFVLKNGSEHIPNDPIINMGEKGMCFMNSFNLVENKNGSLRYVEGYAYKVCIPMLHAWAIDENNYVYDPTWKDGKAYYGVTFPLDYVRKIILRRKKWGVLDCWEIGWPLLTGEDPYPIEDRR